MTSRIWNSGSHSFTFPPQNPNFNSGTVDWVIPTLEFYILFWRNFLYLLLLEKISLTLVILVPLIKRIVWHFDSLCPVIFLFRLSVVIYGNHHLFCHSIKNYITAFLVDQYTKYTWLYTFKQKLGCFNILKVSSFSRKIYQN